MPLKEQLKKLAVENNTPCVSISLNTHRTHPDNLKDQITLKNYLKEAEDRVIAEFGKRPVAALLEKIETVAEEIDSNYNLDSLHIFLSNDTKEIIRLALETSTEGIQILDNFAIRPLIKSYNRSENYLILVLSQGGVQLYEALNDGIVQEITNDDFPFDQTPHYNTFPDRGSDAKHLDDLIREFFNKVDKALVRVHNETDLNCIVISTPENYGFLQQVADKQQVYLGHSSIDYNNSTPHQVVQQAWEVVKEHQHLTRKEAISEMKEAVGIGNVITDLQEIYQAAIDGRGDLLIVHQDFSQPVIMQDERTFLIVNDTTAPNTIDDITSNIAWDVLSKKGRVIFTSQDEIKDLGKIVLKTRF